jgi:hypothetical protein
MRKTLTSLFMLETMNRNIITRPFLAAIIKEAELTNNRLGVLVSHGDILDLYIRSHHVLDQPRICKAESISTLPLISCLLKNMINSFVLVTKA